MRQIKTKDWTKMRTPAFMSYFTTTSHLGSLEVITVHRKEVLKDDFELDEEHKK